jgi:hypothetical protein
VDGILAVGDKPTPNHNIGGGVSRQDKNSKYYNNYVATVEQALRIKRGKPMSIDEADKQKANPNVHKSRVYQLNCSACAATYVMREWGFDVEAAGCFRGSLVEKFYKGDIPWYEMWKNQDGTAANYVSVNHWAKKRGVKLNKKTYKRFYEESCSEVGTYFVSAGRGKKGHFTILKRLGSGKLLRIEPQWNNSKGAPYEYLDFEQLCEYGGKVVHDSRGVMRVDNKLLDTKYLDLFISKNR